MLICLWKKVTALAPRLSAFNQLFHVIKSNKPESFRLVLSSSFDNSPGAPWNFQGKKEHKIRRYPPCTADRLPGICLVTERDMIHWFQAEVAWEQTGRRLSSAYCTCVGFSTSLEGLLADTPSSSGLPLSSSESVSSVWQISKRHGHLSLNPLLTGNPYLMTENKTQALHPSPLSRHTGKRWWLRLSPKALFLVVVS